MGNRSSLLKDPNQLIQRYLPNFTYNQRLGDEQLVLTTMCQTVDQGQVVCKVFLESLENQDKQEQHLQKMRHIQSIFEPRKHPNVLTLMPQRIVTNQFQLLIAYRQYVLYSLLEKMRNKIPKMTYEEKIWLIFQLLCAVAQVHGEDMVHGDIKPENIMVTSYSQLFLTDIKPYKPAYIAVDDLTSRRRFFGELDNQTRSYLAPERFLDSDVGDSIDGKPKITTQMDIFSTGCVIAEILMDGTNLFDPARIQAYRKDDFNPQSLLERHSERKELIELAMSMMALDPKNRPDINTCLQMFKDGQSPVSFHRCFFQLGSCFIRPQYLYSDMKVSLIRKYFISIWRTCFGNRPMPTLYEPVERIIFENLREDFIAQYNGYIKPGTEMFDFMDIEQAADENAVDQIWPESVQVVINWLGTFIQTCHFPQSKRVALEIFLVLARESTLQLRLQSILPFVLKQFDDKQAKVQAKALDVTVLMFENVLDQQKDEQLASIDYKVFDNYILPAIQRLQKSSKDSHFVQVTYTKHLPLIAKIGNYFSELSLSSQISQKQAQKNKQAEITDSQIETNIVKQNTEEEKEAPPANSINTYLNAFVQHDKDIEGLRKQFKAIINDCAARRDDTSAEHLLFAKLGQLCEFFASKDIMDNIIPLLGTCANNKKHLVRQDCLQSVLQVGYKVGKQALQESHMLLIYKDFLYDSEEVVVVKFLKTLVKMLEANLIPKQMLLEDFFSAPAGPKQSLLHKLLPFLLHPNTWIRQQTVRFMIRLSNMTKQNILSQAEVFCVVRKSLKPYLNDPTNVVHFIVRDKSIQNETEHINRLMEMLRTPLSRGTFEGYVKAGEMAFESQEDAKQKLTDRAALDLLHNLIESTQSQYQNYVKLQQGDAQDQVLSLRDWKKFKQYDTYRIISFGSLSEMILKDDSNFESLAPQSNFPQSEQSDNLDKFHTSYYMAMRQYQDQDKDKTNYGINMNGLSADLDNRQYEIDWCMQALEILPDDDCSPIVKYKDRLPTKIANQSLPKFWRLQIEQQTTLCPQPTQIPQVSANYSKTTSLHVSQSLKSFPGSGMALGKRKSQLEDFKDGQVFYRPEGRLVTTLHEHNHPVVSVAVTDNQKMFLTGDKDGQVNIWSTAGIELDASSHSRYQVRTGRKLNSVCTLQGTDSFCVAGGESKLEIFSMSRLPSLSDISRGLSQASLEQKTEQNEVFMPNNASRIQTLEHANEGETIKCLGTLLPVSHQSLVAYCTQRGSIYLHDLRSKQAALQHKNAVQMQRGMLTEMIIGQDPYQLLCGTMGGFVMVYDIRYNTISSAYKHNHSYPINSLAVFKPLEQYDYDSQNSDYKLKKFYNRSCHTSPMVMVAAGGPSFEMSLLNLETGQIEYQMTSSEPQAPSDDSNLAASVQLSEFHRESLIRDSFSYPEKFESNESLYKRYLTQTRSAVSSQQLLLTQSLDDEAFKGSKHRYKFLNQAYESTNACRKILIPRLWSSMTQGTLTCNYAITGGNDMRIRYWNLDDILNKSYFINTPNNDECQHQASTAASGINLIREQICRAKNFPKVNASMFQHLNRNPLSSKPSVLGAPHVEMMKDSIYYKVINDMISQNYSASGNDENSIATVAAAKKKLGLCNHMDQSAGSANKFQFAEFEDRVVVLGYNGLSEWQHFNNLHMNEGNNTLMNQSLNDKWNKSQKSSSKSPGLRASEADAYSASSSMNRGQMDFTNQQREDFLQETRDYLYRDSTNVSHTDAILDMEFVETTTQNSDQSTVNVTPLLVTCGRDCKVKIWR